MLKGVNSRTLKVVSQAKTGVATSLNKEGAAFVDFDKYVKHSKKVKFVHPQHWLPGSTGEVVAKPTSSLLSPARTIGLSSSSIRYIHTDLAAPDFNEYRRKESMDVHSTDRKEGLKSAAYATTGALIMSAGIAAKSVLHPVIQQWSPAADVMALAQIEIKKSDIAVGANRTFKWRGKPLFVRRRTPAEIESAQNVDVSSLRDPEPDNVRTKDPEWLVVLGVCTHLGCVPISHQGAFNGYYCPCHGSHYDTSGRIRQGPAPLNLEVPEHKVEGDLLIVG